MTKSFDHLESSDRGKRPSSGSGAVKGSGAGAGGGSGTEDYDSDPQGGSGEAGIRPARNTPHRGADAPNHGSR